MMSRENSPYIHHLSLSLYHLIDHIEFFKVTAIHCIIPLGIHVQYAFVYLLEISLNFGTNAAVRMFSGNSRR